MDPQSLRPLARSVSLPPKRQWNPNPRRRSREAIAIAAYQMTDDEGQPIEGSSDDRVDLHELVKPDLVGCEVLLS